MKVDMSIGRRVAVKDLKPGETFNDNGHLLIVGSIRNEIHVGIPCIDLETGETHFYSTLFVEPVKLKCVRDE
jgi:hypothetical protein